MQNQGLSKAEIISIVISTSVTVIIFILSLLDKYYGWGPVGLFFLIGLVIAFIVFARNTKFYPYFLFAIGVAFGIGINWGGNMMSSPLEWTSLQSKGLSVSAYSGENDINAGKSTADLSAVIDENNVVEYWFDYELPSDGNAGYVALEYKFLQPQDLYAYDFIEFTIDFIEPDRQVIFYFENPNENGQGDGMLISKNFDLENATVTRVEKEKYSFRIPLSAFKNTNRDNVNEFGFYLHTDFATGKSEVMVSKISFSEK